MNKYQTSEDPISIYHNGSKSIWNRVLILAALSSKTIILRNVSDWKDWKIMISALIALGIKIEYLDSSTLKIVGWNGLFSNINDNSPIYLGNSGTSSRFLLTLTALLPKETSIVYKADERLSSRPMIELINVLIDQNLLQVEYLEKENCFPIKLTSLGNSKWINSISIDCSVTSQFASSLLLCSPFLGTEEIKITLDGNIVSDSYIHLTLAVMKKFGAEFTTNLPYVTIKSTGYCPDFDEYFIEGDFSTAAYDIAYSAIYGQPIQLMNIPHDSIQGEIRLLNILADHFEGFTFEESKNLLIKGVELNQTYQINTDEISLLEGSDWFIALSIIIAIKLPKGTLVKITGIENQRLKEWNRIEKWVEILNSFRVISYELPDGIAIISNPTILKMKGYSITVPTYEDHRLAMAFTILGSTIQKDNRIIIQNGKTVDKTFPEFWKHIETNYNISYYGHVPNLKEDRIKYGWNKNLLILIGMRNSGKSMYSR